MNTSDFDEVLKKVNRFCRASLQAKRNAAEQTESFTRLFAERLNYLSQKLCCMDFESSGSAIDTDLHSDDAYRDDQPLVLSITSANTDFSGYLRESLTIPRAYFTSPNWKQLGDALVSDRHERKLEKEFSQRADIKAKEYSKSQLINAFGDWILQEGEFRGATDLRQQSIEIAKKQLSEFSHDKCWALGQALVEIHPDLAKHNYGEKQIARAMYKLLYDKDLFSEQSDELSDEQITRFVDKCFDKEFVTSAVMFIAKYQISEYLK